MTPPAVPAISDERLREIEFSVSIHSDDYMRDISTALRELQQLRARMKVEAEYHNIDDVVKIHIYENALVAITNNGLTDLEMLDVANDALNRASMPQPPQGKE